jgi:hypothetical protein
VMSALTRNTGSLGLAVAEFRKARTDIEHAYAVFRPLMNAGSGGERLMKTFFAAWNTLKGQQCTSAEHRGQGRC